ncbi:MAG TPA: Z1 domain-containing protein [Nitrospira sp.]|nr:Z1 domain-containing protein [Nitrospira sp.]
MQLDGEVDGHLRIVRIRIDAFGESLSEALEQVPAAYRDEVRARWEEQHQQVIRPANVIAGPGGQRTWFVDWNPSTGYYWRRLRTYLLDTVGRGERDIESLDDSSDLVLSHLEDPREGGPDRFRVQGLVLGYVQSGKTANYSALIAKAADLGYKLVIVLSGIHNALRQQTQRRLDRELGISPEGVGLPEVGRRWISLTTSDLNGDFRPGTLNANVIQGNELVLAVVKKNATVLRRLAEWMGSAAPAELPVLVIDDEADQASINTGGNRLPIEELADLTPEDTDDVPDEQELSPSAINAMIREVLTAFGRVSYVGYTATPFANVLINHEAIDREVFEDLYPRDFIVALPQPAGYVGAETLFGREAIYGELDGSAGLDIIELVPEDEIELLLPGAGEADTFEPGIVPSLQTAIHDFVLATAARSLRAGDGPASMLIHTHQRVRVQNLLAEHIRAFATDLRQRWRYDRPTIETQLRDRWDHEFRPLTASLALHHDMPFEALVPSIDRLFKDPLVVLVLNSASEDVLDFDADPNLKAILIGGNRLSRGLTLEGLLVSYFVRNTRYFDTLLQMGRWFGFRTDYVDLTRLWTTARLSTWFRDLALAEEELRAEIARYEREGLTPRDFGVRIRTHPAMLITARNKMGSARQISQNYAGELIQTINFRLDDRAWLTANLDATRAFLQSLGPPNRVDDARYIWTGVAAAEVRSFFSTYRTHAEATSVDTEFIGQYIARQNTQGELTTWTVAVVSQGSGMAYDEDLGISGFDRIRTIERTRLRSSPWSIGTLVNPATATRRGDEELDLSEEDSQEARIEAADSNAQLARVLRSKRARTDGLLLIYPISQYSSPTPHRPARVPLFDDPASGETVVGIAISFPASDSAATVEYVTGSVGSADD